MSYSTAVNIHRQNLIAGASKMKAGALNLMHFRDNSARFLLKKKKFTDHLSRKDSFVFRHKASESKRDCGSFYHNGDPLTLFTRLSANELALCHPPSQTNRDRRIWSMERKTVSTSHTVLRVCVCRFPHLLVFNTIILLLSLWAGRPEARKRKAMVSLQVFSTKNDEKVAFAHEAQTNRLTDGHRDTQTDTVSFSFWGWTGTGPIKSQP